MEFFTPTTHSSINCLSFVPGGVFYPIKSEPPRVTQGLRTGLEDFIWFRLWLKPQNDNAYDAAIDFLFKEMEVIRPNKAQKCALKSLLANLVCLHHSHKSVMAYFRGRNKWLPRNNWRNPYGVGYGIVELIDLLMDFDFLEGVPGFRDGNRSKASRMWPTQMLIKQVIERFCLLDTPIALHENFQYVQVSIDDEKVAPPANHPHLPAIIEEVKRYNELLSQSDIRLGSMEEKRGKEVWRVFNSISLDEGGRYYGPWWTVEARELRPYITINGQETVELDFKAMHLYMLYDLFVRESYINFYDDGDPYKVQCSSTGEDYPRQLIKDLALIAINSGDFDEIWRAISARYSGRNPETANPALYEAYARNTRLFQPVYDDFLRKHKKLREHLTTYKAGYLQYKDSQIAEKVIRTLTQEGIVVLCIHDSFIVQKDKKEQLNKVMTEAYKEIANTTIEAEIEEKGHTGRELEEVYAYIEARREANKRRGREEKAVWHN